MKNSFFFAALLTALFLSSCTKQERIDPKETLVQEFVQFCQGENEGSLAAFQERFATYEESDFSEEQLERLKNAASKIGFNPFETYMLSPDFEENLKTLEQEYQKSEELK